jgi:predicted nucleic acid-binding protein
VIVYFDSSAIVKLLLREDDFELVRQLWDTATERAVSRLAYPEIRAGLGAAARAGRIAEDDLDRIIDHLERVHDAATVVEVDDLLSIEAGDLADEYALRGYDAVHLASAVNIEAPRVVFATWGKELGVAANACGCAVVPSAA